MLEYLPTNAQGNKTRLTVAEGASVADVLENLGVPSEARMMVILDGAIVERDDFVTTHLGEDAKLSVIPPIQAG